MITDADTNFLYLADKLPKNFPDFYGRLVALLEGEKVAFDILPHTKDIWAVDYMPIQITEDEFVQFVYNPDYLQSQKWLKTIPDVDLICNNIGITTKKSEIILDGGNIVRCRNKVIMCDKVLYENPSYSHKQLVKELKALLQVEYLYFLPQQRGDAIGHADGMVRFLDQDTVIVNRFSEKEDKDYKRSFHAALHNTGLEVIEVPYNTYGNKKDIHANGIYINYLQMQDLIVVPTFGLIEDDEAVNKMTELFPKSKVCTLECNDIANEGGVLNCITWNIKKDNKHTAGKLFNFNE